MAKNVEEKYYLCIDTERNTYISRDGSGERDSTDTVWVFGDIYFEKETDGRRSYSDLRILVSKEDIDKNETYAVIAVWSTGDSFGHDHGHNAEIMSVHHDYEESIKAKDILESIKEDTKNTNKINLGNGYFAPGYIPWHGYFESLCYITIVNTQNSGSIYKKMLTNIVNCYNDGDDYGMSQEIEKAQKTLNL